MQLPTVGLAFSLSFSLLFTHSQSFYVPGISIKSYRADDPIPLFYNKVWSDFTELQYAYAELPFVCPASGQKHPSTNLIAGSTISLNLGEILRGDRITVSDYELSMLHDEEARFLCETTIDVPAMERAQELVAGGYVAEWIVDNLPGATQFVTPDHSKKYYAAGFKLGYQMVLPGETQPRFFLNNHVTLVIRYNTAPGNDGQHGRKVIVGFEVYPKSIETTNRNKNHIPQDVHGDHKGFELTMTKGNATLDETTGEPVQSRSIVLPYTYSVHFKEEKDVDWNNRWDLYFVNQEESYPLHWLAIVNAVVMVAVISSVVLVVLSKTLRGETRLSKDAMLEEGKKKAKGRKPRSSRRSFDKGNLVDPLGEAPGSRLDDEDSSDEEAAEDVSGWKLVHADVFRPPAFGFILAPLIGSGVQLLFMVTGLLILSCLGILNPSFRGGFLSVGFGLFVFASSFSGYFSARVYETFDGKYWKANVLHTAVLIPSLIFSILFVLNLFTWSQASSTAIPFTTLLAILFIWLFFQLPLVYVGGYYGHTRSGHFSQPIKASSIPRQIPLQAKVFGGLPSILAAGVIPFIVVFVELLFIFRSVWLDKSGFYYVFGFASVVGILLVITVAEVSIVATYFLLCYENYHWWWHSFAVGSSSALWIFGYCIWYYFIRLHIHGFISSLLFFSYSGLACMIYGLLMGTVGFLSSWLFVRKIYGAVKID